MTVLYSVMLGSCAAALYGLAILVKSLIGLIGPSGSTLLASGFRVSKESKPSSIRKRGMNLMRNDIQTTLRSLNGMLRVKAGRGWIN